MRDPRLRARTKSRQRGLMGSVYDYETKSGTRYEVRYRKPDGKTARKGGFRIKKDAKAYLTNVEKSVLDGAYIAPNAGKLTVGMLGAQWIAAYKPTVKASQFHSEESSWRVHVEPKWGNRPVASLVHTEIQGWISDLTTQYSASQVRRVHGVLKKILDGAVKDRRLVFNPALEIRLPKKLKGKHAYLSHEQVEQLASTSKYPDLIRFLAYTGLRWGEATGLRVKHVDRELRRVLVEENAVSVNGKIVVGTPKSHERRSVAYPAFLDAAFEASCAGKSSDELVWGNGYEHMRPGDSRRGWFVGGSEALAGYERRCRL